MGWVVSRNTSPEQQQPGQLIGTGMQQHQAFVPEKSCPQIAKPEDQNAGNPSGQPAERVQQGQEPEQADPGKRQIRQTVQPDTGGALGVGVPRNGTVQHIGEPCRQVQLECRGEYRDKQQSRCSQQPDVCQQIGRVLHGKTFFLGVRGALWGVAPGKKRTEACPPGYVFFLRRWIAVWRRNQVSAPRVPAMMSPMVLVLSPCMLMPSRLSAVNS